MSGKKKINFRPIPCVDGMARGYIALSVYPPGTFIGNKQYSVFVGGSGVGERPTEAQAKAYLLASALTACDRRIAEARQTIEHYTHERKRLLDEGLVLEPEL